MLSNEIRICKKCKKPYIWLHGGIVASPKDYENYELCEVCKGKFGISKVLDAIKGKRDE